MHLTPHLRVYYIFFDRGEGRCEMMMIPFWSEMGRIYGGGEMCMREGKSA
jgi:hypothetical protein